MKQFKILWMIIGAFCCIGYQVMAQSIRGKVVNAEGLPIEAVTIVLQRSDSSYVDAALSDSLGQFSFQKAVIPYRLIFQHVAYVTHEITGEKEMVGEVALKESEQALTDVVITAVRPLVKVEEGKLSYDLSLLSDRRIVNNAYDAIRKIPGVQEYKGALTLVGATSLTVILNGKPSNMTAEQLQSLLQNTPVERIEKAEVMYSAPPEYHVRGAVINVVLKRSTDYSFSGIVSADYVQQYASTEKVNGSFRYTTPKMAFDVTYGGEIDREKMRVDLDSRHTFDGTLYTLHNDEVLKSRGQEHSARVAWEYNITPKSHLDVSYFGQFNPSGHTDATTTGNYQLSTLQREENTKLHTATIRYLSPFGMEAGGDFVHYRERTSQQMQIDYVNLADTLAFHVRNGQQIEKASFFIDQKHSLPKAWNLGYGIKYNFVHSSDYQYYNKEEGSREFQDTHSDLNEHTASVYLSTGKSFGTGSSFSAALSGEYYEIGDYNQWNLCPQFSFTWVYRPEHIYQFSLSTNREYPSYWAMQSAVSYLDGYSELHGTPGLRPSLTYSVNASYIFQQKYVARFFFSHEKDVFLQTPYQSNERLALIYRTQNWDYSRRMGVMVLVPIHIAAWYDMEWTAIGLRQRQRCDDFYDIPFDRKNWMAVLRWHNTFRVKSHLSFEANADYRSKAIQGTFDVLPTLSIDLAAKWNFASDRATLSLQLNDLLEKGYPKTEVRFKGQDLDMNSAFYQRSLTVHIAYKLGGYKEKQKSKADTSRFGH